MITRIKISNVNAIKECDLSFEKARYQYLNDMVYNDVVNPIALYGANGSGKSSFLKAMSQLIGLLIDEPKNLSGLMPNLYTFDCALKQERNANGDISEAAFERIKEAILSSIEVFFTLNEKEYVYYIETSLDNISREYLLCDNEKVFDRKGNKYDYNAESFNIDSVLYPVLRKLANNEQLENQTIDAAYNYLSRMAFVDDTHKTYQFKGSVEKSYMDFVVEKSEEVKKVLSSYKDFPLYTIEVRPNPEKGKKDYSAIIEMGDDTFRLPFNLLSSGMKNQSTLLSIALSLPENSAMFIDEIEAALHPLTIMNFINVVKEKNIQLFFSSHNTHVLSKLRPDQVVFASWENGYSQYKRLSDIYPNIREVNNIEKMYLGRMFDEEINSND